MEFSRQEYWSGSSLPSPGDLPDPEIEPGSLTMQADSLPSESLMQGLVPQSCPTLCGPMGCSPPGSSVLEDSPGKNTGVSCHALLQGIFPSQGSNLRLPHCRWILYRLNHQGNTWNTRETPKHYVDSVCTIEWFDASIHYEMTTTIIFIFNNFD